MGKIPKVSVVIPTYNHASFLKKAIESVRAQTFQDWEIIVVNNFSEDNTEEVVHSFCDSRIDLKNFRNNGVIAASRNYGIKISRADYVSFLDSDDVWYPQKLEKSISVLDEGYDLVCHAENWVRNGKIVREVMYGPLKRSEYNYLLFSKNCLSTSAITVRKSKLIEVNNFCEQQSFITAEDYDLWLKLSRIKSKFYFIDKVLGEYTLHESNSSNIIFRQMRAELSVIRKHLGEIGQTTLLNIIKYMLRVLRTYLAYGVRSIRKGSVLNRVGNL